ncbi:VapE domain-containing protein [Spirosoma spitsbergense]|uniref:VapE domain-containing protein n=1 Tax=Spirosoma spitsbergense TaxID=431554 RepID=UPI0003791B22|nr:VapE domain-containing protein [Spirosoma spitsbergense]
MIKTIDTTLIGYYKKRNSTEGVDLSFTEFINAVRTGPEWKKHCLWVREAVDDKAEYDKRKAQSACVIIGGTFDGEKKAENLRDPSGLLAADLDVLNERTEAIRFQLAQDPYVVAVFKSIGGRGLCVVFKIDSGRFLESFNGIADYLITKYGLVGKQFDPSSSNINRLRYITHDPEAYYNPKARLFAKYPRKEAKAEKPFKKYIDSDTNISHIIEQIDARAVDIAPGYSEWYKVGWALISAYGEGARGLFQQISQYNQNYDPDEVDKKFNYLTATRPQRITISTFYYYCKLAGIDIMTPATKEVVSLAAMAKKNKIRDADEALKGILKMTAYTEEEARPIVEQVYASPEAFDIEETLFDQLELFLKQEYPMRRNEISRYIENEAGRGFIDEDFNGIWVHAVKILGEKISDKMVNKLIHSSFTPTYNPLKNFFQENKKRKPVGVIKALAATIETSSGFEDNSSFPDYAEFIIRKWLLGMISAIYDEHCPLVLVLTGKKGTGKTEWFRRLLPPELKRYFAETTWPISKDTDLLMSENIITFNDEWKGKTVKDPETLKGYASIDQFTLREPYGKSMVKRRRLALMCGTSNPTQIISDPDNNRKIVAINIKSIDYIAYNAIDKVDLLMEAYHAYTDGERHHLTKNDIERIANEVRGFEDYSLEHNLITEYIRMPSGAGGEDMQRLSTTKIMLYLENKANGRKLSETMVGRELAALGYEKKRYRGDDSKRLYGYDVIFEV